MRGKIICMCMLYKCLISTNVEISNNFSECDFNLCLIFTQIWLGLALEVDHVDVSEFFSHFILFNHSHKSHYFFEVTTSRFCEIRAKIFTFRSFPLLGRIYVIDLPMRNPSLDVTTQCCQMPRGINFPEHFMKIPAHLLVNFVKISIKDFIFSKICNANIFFILLSYYIFFILLYTLQTLNGKCFDFGVKIYQGSLLRKIIVHVHH